jgi:hypothetical protein
MGTNYYLHQQTGLPAPDDEIVLHIGKSSGGWCFSLHVMPERGINDLQDWIALIEKLGPLAKIRDEYGTELLLYELMEIITIRWMDRSVEESVRRSGGAGGLYTMSVLQEFLDLNKAELGPNNLLRHRIHDRWCVKHGSGTWDCILGEFS